MPTPRTESPCVGRIARTAALLAALAATIGCTAPTPESASAATKRTAPTRPAGGLVVHEWGTFTSMMAPDGSLLGGMHHSEERLPNFVAKARTLLAEGADAYLHEPTQRMETPVLYLYSERALDVDVEVAFPFGLMSEWYPEAATVTPSAPAVEQAHGGALRWEVRVEPGAPASKLPTVSEDDIWAPSRRVDAPMLRTRRLRPEVPGPEQWERLLFYRGVGEFALPVQLREVDASLQVRFGGQRTIPAAWLIRVEGEQAGFRALGALAPDELRSVAGLQADRPAAAVVHEAATALVRGLQESGLYEDEARAMVDTWRRAWLRSPGTRLLYVLPRPWTDALLPLRVRPRPQQIERVLVGRVELLTQAMIERDRATLDEAVALAALRGTGDAAWALFGKLQPFAEPRLRWLCAQPGDEGHAAVCRGALRWSHRR